MIDLIHNQHFYENFLLFNFKKTGRARLELFRKEALTFFCVRFHHRVNVRAPPPFVMNHLHTIHIHSVIYFSDGSIQAHQIHIIHVQSMKKEINMSF